MAQESIFGNLIIEIQKKIKTDVPEIKWIDQELGQLDFYDPTGRPAVQFPCLLIDFPQAQYKQTQKGQWAAVQIQCKMAFDPYSNSNSITPDQIKLKALEYYEIENKVYKALQNWKANGLLFEPMIRISATTERRPQDFFRSRIMNFKSSYEDLGVL